MSLPLNEYPYTDLHELNLDYIMKRVNDFDDRLTEDETILNTLPDYIKNVSLTNNTLKFTKGNNSTIDIVLPSGAPFNLVVTEDPDEKTVNDETLSVDDEINFITYDYEYDAVRALDENVKAGNVGRLTIIDDALRNVSFSSYVYYSSGKLFTDLMIRYFDSDTQETVYQWRSFIINYSYTVATHKLTLTLKRVK